MPSCAIQHRVTTGVFTWTLIFLLYRKAASFNRRRKYRGWCADRQTLTFTLASLTLSLLLLCGDVESNPGPLEPIFPFYPPHQMMDRHSMQQPMSSDEKLDRILCMNMKFEHRFQTLEHNLATSYQQISQQLHGMEGSIKRHADQLNTMTMQQDDLQTRLKTLEDAVERREQLDRRSNLLFYGLKEVVDEVGALHIIVQLLNHCFPQKTWCDRDIGSVHRLGKQTVASQPRPLFINFSQQSDAVLLLRDKDGRNRLRNSQGVRVAADLTKHQRDTMANHKREGRRAFYFNGRLIVQDSATDDHRHHSTRGQNRGQHYVSGGRSGTYRGPQREDVRHVGVERQQNQHTALQSRDADEPIPRVSSGGQPLTQQTRAATVSPAVPNTYDVSAKNSVEAGPIDNGAGDSGYSQDSQISQAQPVSDGMQHTENVWRVHGPRGFGRGSPSVSPTQRLSSPGSSVGNRSQAKGRGRRNSGGSEVVTIVQDSPRRTRSQFFAKQRKITDNWTKLNINTAANVNHSVSAGNSSNSGKIS
eukprot:TRINITY_DN2374_c0_g1_i10.p2 TRINITY_DN2374_c0_g1~~TRINITY_DN2374_c0_g1_i10.p2  ORF type:complete len:530 (+),score=95.71 TRINITY_DN2374_c0_g1_i10:115-1704(+)